MAISRYWRLVGICTPGNGALELSEARIYENGVVADTGATLTCTVTPDSGSLTDLRDDLTTGVVSWSYEKYSQPGFALVWDFGAAGGVEFPRLRLGSGNSAATYISDVLLQMSTNGVDWVPYATPSLSATYPGNVSMTSVSDVIEDIYLDQVVLAMHMDGTNASTTFTDLTGKTVTRYGNAVISTAQSKFGGASAYFDGSGDYLTVADSADFEFGSGDFTIEFFTRITSNTAQVVLSKRSSADFGPFQIYMSTAANLQLSTSGTAWDIQVAGHPVTNSQFVHIAAVRLGGSIRIFTDGIASASVNIGTVALFLNSTPISIAGTSDGAFPLTGYIDDLRITKGVARYATDFTPPTAPFPFDLPRILPGYGGIRIDDPYFESVVLAMHMDGTNASTTFTDLTGKTVTRYGNAVISTVQSKFGGASAYFDGNGDYLGLGAPAALAIGIADFTIEFWMRIAAYGGTGVANDSTLVGCQAGVGGFFLYADWSDGRVKWFDGAVGMSSTPSTALATWKHVAVCRKSGTLSFFIDGVLSGSFPGYNYAVSSSGVVQWRIGGNFFGDSTRFFNGYIDDLRITKGVARYTDNFTPPTEPFPSAIYSAYAGAAPPSRTRQLAPLPERLLPADELPVTTVHGHLREFPFFDVYNGGLGLITGTVKEKALPANTPLHRKVWLMDEASGMVIRETWSDATTGDYEFRGVKQGVKYTVLAYDYTGQYRAVIADAQIPELIP